MKKSTVKPKLELKRKTVKQLTASELGNAAGGLFAAPSVPKCCTGGESGCAW